MSAPRVAREPTFMNHEPQPQNPRVPGSSRPTGARRRPPASGVWTIVLAAALAHGMPAAVRAQGTAFTEGALDLLLPTGARAVAIGQAATAVGPSTEAVWWNPSGLAQIRGTQAAIHHSQSIGGTADAVAVVARSAVLGSFAVSASLRDFGATASTDDSQTEVGTILPRSLIYAATYAAAIERVSVGVTYKYLQWRLDCTGGCPAETGVIASTSALDAGAQVSLDPKLPVTVGASVRNVGLEVQVNDEQQSDPLPSRVQAGVQVRLSALGALVPGAELRVNADLVSEMRRLDPSPRLGAEVAFQRLHFRGGYASPDGGYGGPSLGVGYEVGSLSIDFARLFDDVSSTIGTDPTYLSVRYRF